MIDIDRLVNELILLVENNYGLTHKNNFESHFYKAKKDILKRIDEIIEDNKKEVRKEVLKKE